MTRLFTQQHGLERTVVFVGKSFEERVCLSCRHYLITTSIQLETDAAQLLNYTSRIELVGSGNFERSKLVVQLLHPISTINMVLDSECNESTASVAELLSSSRCEGLNYT